MIGREEARYPNMLEAISVRLNHCVDAERFRLVLNSVDFQTNVWNAVPVWHGQPSPVGPRFCMCPGLVRKSSCSFL